MTSRQKKIALIGGVAVLALVGWRVAGSFHDTKKRPSPAVPVAAMTIVPADVPLYVTGLGTVQAYNTVTVRARVDGQLTDVKFDEGEDVSKGQVLAHIDARSYEAALHNAEATLAKDQASLTNAKQDLERYRQTAASGYTSAQRVDTQVATVNTLTAQLQGDQAMVENARVQLSYTTVTAPIAGRTGIRMVDAGNVVRAAETNGLVVITQVQPISATFTLPQSELPRVADAAAKGPLAATAFSRDEDVAFDQGNLELIDNQIDPASGTVRVKVTFPNEHRKLWPGQFINLRLQVGTVHDGIAVPARVVQRGDAGPYVYVIKADDTVEMRTITARAEQNGLIVVTKGLSAGDRVVVDGQLRLSPGAKVKIDLKAAAIKDAGVGEPGDDEHHGDHL